MQNQLSGAIIRMHGPLNLQLWDRIVAGVGVGFLALGAALHAWHATPPALVATGGGAVLLALVCCQRRQHVAAVWLMAASEPDPVLALSLHEYLYRLRFRDLLVVAEWRARQDRLGLPVWDEEDPHAPPQVQAIYAHLRSHPWES